MSVSTVAPDARERHRSSVTLSGLECFFLTPVPGGLHPRLLTLAPPGQQCGPPQIQPRTIGEAEQMRRRILNADGVAPFSPGSRSAPWVQGTRYHHINPARVAQVSCGRFHPLPRETPPGFYLFRGAIVTRGALRDPGLSCGTALRFGCGRRASWPATRPRRRRTAHPLRWPSVSPLHPWHPCHPWLHIPFLTTDVTDGTDRGRHGS